MKAKMVLGHCGVSGRLRRNLPNISHLISHHRHFYHHILSHPITMAMKT